MTTKGPKKQFFSTFTFRVTPADLKYWKEAARKQPERISLSQWARGVLNRAAFIALGK